MRAREEANSVAVSSAFVVLVGSFGSEPSAQTASTLPIVVVRAWSPSQLTVQGIGTEQARVDPAAPAVLTAIAAAIVPPSRIERVSGVFGADGRCCAGLSVVLDDSRRINSWETQLLTAGGGELDPAAAVVLDRMACVAGRTLPVSGVRTDVNLEDLFRQSGDAPRLLFVYKIEGSTAGLKWRVGSSEPVAITVIQSNASSAR